MYFFKDLFLKISNLFEYAKEHWFRMFLILVLFVVFGLVFYFIPHENIIEDNVLKEQHILILGITLDNWLSYLSLIALIVTAIWAIYQFDKNIARKQQEKGAEIAKLFAQDLLMKCEILGKVILDSELSNLFKLKELDYDTFKHFDRAEIYNIYSDDNILTKLKLFLSSNELQQLYLHYLKRNISLEHDVNEIYSDKDYDKIFILNNISMPFRFTQLISSVLNDLEYISMYIASQSAGSKYVYQSLHQIFLRTVKILAPIIASQNKDYSDKYYTHVIYVYNEWTNLRKLDKKKEDKKKERASKILNPKIRTI